MNRHSKSLQSRVVERARSIDSPYLTSQEAVVYLRLRTLSALYRLVDEHALPHGRRGRLHLFDKRELDAWVKGFGSSLELVRSRKTL